MHTTIQKFNVSEIFVTLDHKTSHKGHFFNLDLYII